MMPSSGASAEASHSPLAMTHSHQTLPPKIPVRPTTAVAKRAHHAPNAPSMTAIVKSHRPSSVGQTKYTPTNMLEKLVEPLPYDSQQSIIKMVSIMQVNARNAGTRAESMKHEMAIIKSECERAKEKLTVAQRQIDNLNTHVRESANQIEALKELILDKDEQATRNKIFLERLRYDNTLLKESVEAMDLSAPRGANRSPTSRPTSAASSSSGSPSRPTSAVSTATTTTTTTRSGHGRHPRLPRDDPTADADAGADPVLSAHDDTVVTDDADDETQWLLSSAALTLGSTAENSSIASAIANVQDRLQRSSAGSVTLPAIAPTGPGSSPEAGGSRGRVQFDSSITGDAPRTPRTQSTAGGDAPSSGVRRVPSSPSQTESSKGEQTAVAAALEEARVLDEVRSRSKERSLPKDDYILPQSDTPVDGTFRNMPDSHLIEKLRNALLRMTRDKYRAEKREKILNKHIDNLKAEGKELSSKIRHLQIELAEYRGHSEGIEFASTFKGNAPVWVKEKSFGPMDELFKTLIERRAFNPVDMILQFRRIVDYLSRLPSTLNAGHIAHHIGSKEVMQILEVDMLVVYVSEPNAPHTVHKYTIRADRPEVMDLTDAKSMVGEVFHQKRSMKINSKIRASVFNDKVDGCPGVVARNVLTVPLMDEKTKRVVGAIQSVNKAEGTSAFTELDELFMSVYASMCTSALLACEKHRHVAFRTDVVAAIVDAPTGLLGLVPDPTSMFVRDVQAQAVLKVLEDTAKSCLRCLRVKAFLASDSLANTENELLLALDAKLLAAASAPMLRKVPLLRTGLLGVAGLAARTRKVQVSPAGDPDPRAHPDVDMDASGLTCYTVPLLNVKGQVLGCLQLLPGPGSPKITLTEGRDDGITFEQAAAALALALRAPLQVVMATVGEDLTKSFSEQKGSFSRGPSTRLLGAMSSKSGTTSTRGGLTTTTTDKSVKAGDMADVAEDLDEEDVDVGDNIFEDMINEMRLAQERLAEMTRENDELKRAYESLQQMYLNETRDKTMSKAERGGGLRRSFGT